MRKLPLYVSLLVAWASWSPAEAQFLGRKNKANPGQRVPELIVTAKTDPDERKRIAAAAELRDYDANTFPEIVSVLADVARTDTRVAVRQEAVDSLSRLRPVSQLAGQTLEWSAGHDESWKVRWQAKSALMRYNWTGYNKSPQAPATAPGPASTQEPPLIEPPRGYQAPKRPQAAPPTVTEPQTRRGTSEPNAASPGSAGLFSRMLPSKKSAPPAPGNGAKNVTPIFPPQSPPSAAVAPVDQAWETPPPLVIETPSRMPAAAPAKDAVKSATASAPPATASPATASPATASGRPRSNATEPNFRPAGQGPPRSFTTAVPQAPNIIAPGKQQDEVPILIPPM